MRDQVRADLRRFIDVFWQQRVVFAIGLGLTCVTPINFVSRAQEELRLVRRLPNGFQHDVHGTDIGLAGLQRMLVAPPFDGDARQMNDKIDLS